MSDERGFAGKAGRGVETYHRSIFETSGMEPSEELVNAVAELKGVGQNELDPLYSWIDGLVQDLYSSPPPASAQAEIRFNYEGFRITLYQDGHAVFVDQTNA